MVLQVAGRKKWNVLFLEKELDSFQNVEFCIDKYCIDFLQEKLFHEYILLMIAIFQFPLSKKSNFEI